MTRQSVSNIPEGSSPSPRKVVLLSLSQSLWLVTFHAVSPPPPHTTMSHLFAHPSFYSSPAARLCCEGQLPQLTSIFGKPLRSMQVIPDPSGQSHGLSLQHPGQSCVSHVLLRTAPLRLWFKIICFYCTALLVSLLTSRLTLYFPPPSSSLVAQPSLSGRQLTFSLSLLSLHEQNLFSKGQWRAKTSWHFSAPGALCYKLTTAETPQCAALQEYQSVANRKRE